MYFSFYNYIKLFLDQYCLINYGAINFRVKYGCRISQLYFPFIHDDILLNFLSFVMTFYKVHRNKLLKMYLWAGGMAQASMKP
jgi:hypothetical protein